MRRGGRVPRAQVAIASGPVPWQTFVVTESRSAPNVVGQGLATVAASRGAHPADVLMDLAVADDLGTRVELTYGNDDPAEVARLLSLPGVVLGLSDAGAHPAQSCDAVMPTDLLGPWVRDRSALTLEAAVHKLTAEPADLFSFAGRGRIATGWAADLVVFDPDTVGPGPLRRAVDMPAGGERLLADAPTGIDQILINGTLVRRDGVALPLEANTRPGRVLGPR